MRIGDVIILHLFCILCIAIDKTVATIGNTIQSEIEGVAARKRQKKVAGIVAVDGLRKQKRHESSFFSTTTGSNRGGVGRESATGNSAKDQQRIGALASQFTQNLRAKYAVKSPERNIILSKEALAAHSRASSVETEAEKSSSHSSPTATAATTNISLSNYYWLPKEAVIWAINEFRRWEKLRPNILIPTPTEELPGDRRTSSPFISGNGYREHCYPHVCEENQCKGLRPENVKDGQCIFVRASMLDFFVKHKMHLIPKRYRLITDHADDQSTPDSLALVRKDLGLEKRFELSPVLEREYNNSRLITHFAVNLWWHGYKTASGGSDTDTDIGDGGKPRPEWAHCVPIGLENRDCQFGRQIEELYITAMEQFVLNRNRSSSIDDRPKELLLVNINPKGELRKPDRVTVQRVFSRRRSVEDDFFTIRAKVAPMQWLEFASQFRFVLCPFGHGLDTHRVTEVLLMGGIPVIRRSSITSCFDDSDNEMMGGISGSGSLIRRGSLPIVVVNDWREVTKNRLISEWQRISSVDPSTWDWKRLFIDHWLERLDNAPDKATIDRNRHRFAKTKQKQSSATTKQPQPSIGGGVVKNKSTTPVLIPHPSSSRTSLDFTSRTATTAAAAASATNNNAPLLLASSTGIENKEKEPPATVHPAVAAATEAAAAAPAGIVVYRSHPESPEIKDKESIDQIKVGMNNSTITTGTGEKNRDAGNKPDVPVTRLILN